MYSPTWRRPVHEDYPKVWRTFERQTNCGRVLKFQIKDMTEETYKEVFTIMEKYFLKEETFHKTSGISNPSAHVTFIRGLVERIMLPQRLSLVCLVNDVNNISNKKSIETVAGYNFLGVAKKSETLDLSYWINHETGEKFLAILKRVKNMCPNLMEKYGVEEYIGSLGLCIHPDYRGLKIAEELLNARFALCRALDIKLTYSTFTASASQKIAVKCGFHEEQSISYEEAEKQLDFKFVTEYTHCKVMSKYLN